jgi:HAD superfamily hydrolase (TIGR01509 family)
MDGLLLDTQRLANDALIEAGQKFDIVFEPPFVKTLVGLNERDSYYKIIEYAKRDICFETLGKTFHYLYQKKIQEKGVPLKKGVISLLDYCKKQGLSRGVVTSTSKGLAEEKLQKAGILKDFSFIIGGGCVEYGKPHPEPYEKGLEALGLEAHQCFVLEDSDTGARSGIAAGISTLVVPDGDRPSPWIKDHAYAILNTLEDVMPILKKINAQSIV